MPDIDPYRILQVHRDADVEIIQVAYRKLAQRYHPDVAASPDAARRMAELNAAREILADPERRAEYDRAAEAAPAGAAPAAGAAPGTSTGPAPAARPAGRPATSQRTTRPPVPDPVAAPGPPPGKPSGSVLGFGRYAGWSLGEITRVDVEYIEWLDRMPIGRPHRAELDAILRTAGRRGPGSPADTRRGLFRR